MNTTPHPPRWAAWLLARFRLRGDHDILLGDFEEEYHYLRQRHGSAYARRWYITHVLMSLPGFFDQMLNWSLAMLRNYLKVAVRTFRKQPIYTLINTVGLALGVACCILLFLFVQDELSFDRFHERADRIYRLERIQEVSHSRSSFTDGPSGPALVEAYAEVEAATRVRRIESLVSFEDQRFFGEDIAYVDSSFLRIFSFELLHGDMREALARPNSIVLTVSMAQKYFGEADPLGQVVRVDNETDFVVRGIVADVPHNSHYQFDALASIPSLYPKFPWLENFGSISVQTYVLLAPGVDPAGLEKKFDSFVEAHNTFSTAYLLRPLTNIHLYSDVFEVDQQGDIESVYLFSAIALFILLLACINYINLATARSSRRMREVGMRKVLGADRVQLIFQFLGESIVLTLGALVLALVFVLAALPVLNAFLDRSLSLGALVAGQGLLLLGAYGLVVSILAGSYPAVYLARFKPVLVLKKGAYTVRGKSRLRQFLVITQFVVSIVLLAATLVVGFQLRYMQQKHLGFNSEQVVNLYLRDAQLLDKVDVLKQELGADAQVVGVTVSSSGVDEVTSAGPLTRADDEDFSDEVIAGLIYTDEDYLDTFGMRLAAGRAFSTEQAPSSASDLLINEALVRALGWATAEDAVGQLLHSEAWGLEGMIIGVVEDFHIRPLRQSVPPVVMVNSQRADDSIVSVRLRPGDTAAALARFEGIWNRVAPEWPFEAAFLNQIIQQRYERDRKESQLFSVFASLAILIACLGLFGLAAFMGQQRTKEIGIRKVMGASVRQIVFLLSKEFTTLVGVAFVLAAPIAYLLMDRWLGNFAYHIDLDWYHFALAGFFALAAAGLTVSYQAIQSAWSDPVEMLRYE